MISLMTHFDALIVMMIVLIQCDIYQEELVIPKITRRR
jgi:hypothetical protein